MTSTLRRGLAAAAVLAAALVAPSGTSVATTTPPWEPDANSVGGLLFFDSAGNKITGGSINDHPLAAYIEGTSAIRAGDTNAALYGYQPVKDQLPSQWSGDLLTGSTAYPNASAPGALGTATLPVLTGQASDFSIADLISDYPTTTDVGYQNVYQVRLITSASNAQANAKYDSADILVDTVHNTWSVEYTKVPLTATTTALATSASKVTHGSKLTLTATVSPAVAGKVKFLDGSKTLRTVSVNAGKATYSTTTLAGGSHKLKATFVPTDTLTYAGSSSSVHTVTVLAQATTTTLKSSASTIKRGRKLTLSATEKPTTAGAMVFFNGTTKLGSVTVRSGAASLSTTRLTVGSHKLKATFTPSNRANYKTSTSKTITVQVIK